MNLEVLRKRRKDPQVGDIFAYRLKGRDYGFGRVIRTDARMQSTGGLLLIYLYKAFSPDKAAIPPLDKRQLLLPPLLLSDKGCWTRGYFETLAHGQLAKSDVHSPHCFRSKTFLCYFDEYGKKLTKRTSPCGLHALDSHYTVDVMISLALGIEPDPDSLPQRRGERRGK